MKKMNEKRSIKNINEKVQWKSSMKKAKGKD